MTRMTKISGPVTGGVDTHGATHHAAVLDQLGRPLGDREFPATAAGYRQLHVWLKGHDHLERVGVEGTGSYGVGLARHLRSVGVVVVEVDRPDRKARRSAGKSDPIDAYAAARAALNGTATGTPKTRDGHVEAIRVFRVARSSAIKSRTQTINQLKALLVTGPAGLREQLADKTTHATVEICARLRPGVDIADPNVATKTALRHLARRHQALSAEIEEIDTDIAPLVALAAPCLLVAPGIGTDCAGQLLITAGDNPDRLHSEAAFAHLCGVAPIPASSGQTTRHRLHRGGDRQANNALHTIALSRMHHDPRTKAYVERRRAQGLGTKEIMRCLKRYIAREVYQLLQRS